MIRKIEAGKRSLMNQVMRAIITRQAGAGCAVKNRAKKRKHYEEHGF